jgi:hypothetical protein
VSISSDKILNDAYRHESDADVRERILLVRRIISDVIFEVDRLAGIMILPNVPCARNVSDKAGLFEIVAFCAIIC